MRKHLRMAGTLAAAAVVVLMVGGFTSRPTAGGTAAQPAAAAAAKIRPGGLLVRATPGAGTSAARAAASLANALESTNWAGYVSHQANVSFQKVEATFFVPYLNCTVSPGGTTPTASSAWVGIDGFTSGTVEQDGIEADCNGGTPSYSAWYEVFPAPEVTSSIAVHPGDSVTALVAYNKATQKFQMTVNDNNNGQHFTVTKVCGPATCKRSSAEVISEAPSEVSGTTETQLPLADYGAESFASVAVTNSSGFTGGLRSARWGAARIIQVGATSGNVVGQSTPLHGTIFDNYWLGEI
jgi:hypothetical protein